MAQRGGTHEQHVKAGQQSHKNSSGRNDDDRGVSASSRNSDGTFSSGSNSSGSSSSRSSGSQGGSHEQHVKAGQQSHKNSH